MKKALVFSLVVLAISSCTMIVEELVIYDERDQFTGSYRVEEYSATYDEFWEYSMSIWKSGSRGNSVVIDNFYNSGIRVSGWVNGNRIEIPAQFVDGFEIAGSGSTNGGRIKMTYSVRDTYSDYPHRWDDCDMKAWKN